MEEYKKTRISKYEYDEMIQGLKQYKDIPELRDIINDLERQIKKLNIYC